MQQQQQQQQSTWSNTRKVVLFVVVLWVGFFVGFQALVFTPAKSQAALAQAPKAQPVSALAVVGGAGGRGGGGKRPKVMPRKGRKGGGGGGRATPALSSAREVFQQVMTAREEESPWSDARVSGGDIDSRLVDPVTPIDDASDEPHVEEGNGEEDAGPAEGGEEAGPSEEGTMADEVGDASADLDAARMKEDTEAEEREGLSGTGGGGEAEEEDVVARGGGGGEGSEEPELAGGEGPGDESESEDENEVEAEVPAPVRRGGGAGALGVSGGGGRGVGGGGGAGGGGTHWMADGKSWVIGKFQGDEFVPQWRTTLDNHDWNKAKYFPVSDRYKMFGERDARKCLAGKKVVIIGDSYMRGMYVGLVDVVRGNTSDLSRHYATPKALSKMVEWYNLNDDTRDFQVKHMTQKHSLLDGDLMGKLNTPERMATLRAADYVVMNSMIHDIKQRTMQSLNMADGKLLPYYVNYVMKWVDLCKRNGIKLVWATGVSYKLEHVDPRYRKEQNDKRMLLYNTKLIQKLKGAGVPFLDIYHMTMGCTEMRCLDGYKDKGMKPVDGAHRSRHVNRMKAQMLMNYICPPPARAERGPPRENKQLAEMHKFRNDDKILGKATKSLRGGKGLADS